MEEQARGDGMGYVGAEVYGEGMGDERETTEWTRRADDSWCSLGSNGEGKGVQMEASGSV